MELMANILNIIREQHFFEEKTTLNEKQKLNDLKLHNGLFRQIRVRKYRDYYVVTVGLINKNTEKGYKNCYFQPEIIVENINVGLSKRLEASTFSSKDEEVEAQFDYRSKKIFVEDMGYRST